MDHKILIVAPLMLLVLGGAAWLVYNQTEKTLEQQADQAWFDYRRSLTVYVESTENEDMLALMLELESMSEVESVTFISAEEALENFKWRHRNDQLTTQALDELNANPFRDELRIVSTSPDHVKKIVSVLQGSGLSLIIDEPSV